MIQLVIAIVIELVMAIVIEIVKELVIEIVIEIVVELKTPQGGPMDTIHELDSGLTEENGNMSFISNVTVKREYASHDPSSHKLLCMSSLKFQASVVISNTRSRFYCDLLLHKVTSSLFFLLVGLCVKTNGNSESTQQSWLYFNNSFYFISSTKKNWMDSRDVCKETRTCWLSTAEKNSSSLFFLLWCLCVKTNGNSKITSVCW
ncbi:hypothetical protein N1851_027348 [Merluccius polli]|uniref:C-type lectin domain-containing protein n=1 Tax=Merluccius polli TaxID=89951 RepID=A0AA47NTG7_MERPO|nr:hypothetical protein N1851_027348 [Merluccius polli]